MSQKVSYMSHFADKTISKVYLSMCDLYILDKCANFAAQIPRKRGSRQGGRRRRSEAVDSAPSGKPDDMQPERSE